MHGRMCGGANLLLLFSPQYLVSFSHGKCRTKETKEKQIHKGRHGRSLKQEGYKIDHCLSHIVFFSFPFWWVLLLGVHIV